MRHPTRHPTRRLTRRRRRATAHALRAFAICALAAAFLAGSLAAQDSAAREGAAAPEPEGAFYERVDVSVITVDVVVTDKAGNPVTGLGRDDFEISEDGRPVEITNFYAVEGGARVAPAPPPAAPAGTATDPAPQAPALESAEPPLQLVVYVDNVNIRPGNRQRVFRDLRQFLAEKLGPDDRVMLVSYERSLKVKRAFTGDTRLIADALFELEELASNVTQADEERRNLIERIEEARSPDHARTWLRVHSQSVQNDLRSTLRAVRELVESLAGLPGRKALLYVSDGLPMTPGEEFYVAAQTKFPRESFVLDARSFDASASFQELAALANSNRVSFYTLDAAGVRISSAIDVERGGGGTYGFYNTLDSATVANLQSSLKFLADATGGTAIVNTNNFRPGLDGLAGDFESYYSLGYQVGHLGDGRYHKIKVDVKQRGLVVRHREGYRDKPLHTRMADATLSTLRWGLEGNNRLGIKLEFRPASAGDQKGEAVVPMVVEIPLKGVALVPRGETWEGRVKLFVAVADARSRVALPQELPVHIQIPADELERARESSYHYKIPLRMRTGGQRVAVGVYDEISAIESFVSMSVAVGSV